MLMEMLKKLLFNTSNISLMCGKTVQVKKWHFIGEQKKLFNFTYCEWMKFIKLVLHLTSDNYKGKIRRIYECGPVTKLSDFVKKIVHITIDVYHYEHKEKLLNWLTTLNHFYYIIITIFYTLYYIICFNVSYRDNVHLLFMES